MTTTRPLKDWSLDPDDSLGLAGIKGITIKGYRSFSTQQTIHFGDRITLLYGPNSSGKSSFLDMLDMLTGGDADGIRLRRVEYSEITGYNYLFGHISGRVTPSFFPAQDDSKQTVIVVHIEDALCYRYDLETRFTGEDDSSVESCYTEIRYRVKDGDSRLLNYAREMAPEGKFTIRSCFPIILRPPQLESFLGPERFPVSDNGYDLGQLHVMGGDDSESYVSLEAVMQLPIGQEVLPSHEDYLKMRARLVENRQSLNNESPDDSFLENLFICLDVASWKLIHLPPLRMLDWPDYIVFDSKGQLVSGSRITWLRDDPDAYRKWLSEGSEDPRVAKWLMDHMRISMLVSEASLPDGACVLAPRFKDLETGAVTRLSENGEGLRQVLPILMSNTAMVEQPELHLHPRLQGDLADYIIDVCSDKGGYYILETHSEAIMLRIQRRIREGKLRPEDVAVNYFDKVPGKGTIVTHLRLDEEGNFIDEWPDGFFEDGLDDIIGGL